MKINELLNSIELMDILQDLAETGASIGTMEAKLCMGPGQLARWLSKGKEKPKTPYRVLYNKMRSWIAEARAAAEAQQLAKTPTQWLERNSSSRLLEPETTQYLPGLLPQQTNSLNLGAAAVIAALKNLQESGVNIDEAIRKNQIQVALPAPTQEPIEE